jgi:hypothetical protein
MALATALSGVFPENAMFACSRLRTVYAPIRAIER